PKSWHVVRSSGSLRRRGGKEPIAEGEPLRGLHRSPGHRRRSGIGGDRDVPLRPRTRRIVPVPLRVRPRVAAFRPPDRRPLRAPDGDRELHRGDFARYPAGPEGAHQITNRSDRAARVLLFSKAAVPAISVYPDTDTIGVWPDDDTEYYFKRDSAVSRDVD